MESDGAPAFRPQWLKMIHHAGFHWLEREKGSVVCHSVLPSTIFSMMSTTQENARWGFAKHALLHICICMADGRAMCAGTIPACEVTVQLSPPYNTTDGAVGTILNLIFTNW